MAFFLTQKTKTDSTAATMTRMNETRAQQLKNFGFRTLNSTPIITMLKQSITSIDPMDR